MELSNHHHHQEDDIPVPINTSYSGHMIHHLELPISSAPQIHSNGNSTLIPSSAAVDVLDHDHGAAAAVAAVVPYKKPAVIRYRECLKNHAASMGGNATDGCGEFMPSGEEGTIEALTCSACNCHRNFHRKEVEAGDYFHNMRTQRKLLLTHHHNKTILGSAPDQGSNLGYPTATGALIPSRSAPHHHQMIMSYNMGPIPSESDEQEDGGGAFSRPAHSHHNYNNHHHQQYHHQHHRVGKKRFRTKFSQEQKEKMLNFAEKVGWKIQKQEESIVQQFCQEIGVKRRVLKVWMHNNKHSLAKKNINSAIDHHLP
ncbi:zinc-finger homeodomain protein 3-like [Impatiens glandulifera]|uniref:zinc-finger homeodomain protein 3-like n=1 Tax=Impatiens glandulifera TaxID=253017 RepID=UPI001FB0BE2D|nr:zinc-finger homeodomain protein 3-like [Impatiens glandulifera]